MLRGWIKIFGGCGYKYKWIIENFPAGYENMTYVEPFIGSGVVLLNKNPSIHEVINDIDPRVVSIPYNINNNFYELQTLLSEVPYTEERFNQAKEAISKGDFVEDIDYAVNSYILFRMSRSGLCEDFAWSDRQRGGQPGDVNAFVNSIRNLEKIRNRIQYVKVCYSDFIRNLHWYEFLDDPNCFIFCDPPFVSETRVTKQAYRFEMSIEDHKHLLKNIKRARAKVAILGYESPLYNEMLSDWRVSRKTTANHSGQNKKKNARVDCLWMNYG